MIRTDTIENIIGRGLGDGSAPQAWELEFDPRHPHERTGCLTETVSAKLPLGEQSENAIQSSTTPTLGCSSFFWLLQESTLRTRNLGEKRGCLTYSSRLHCHLADRITCRVEGGKKDMLPCVSSALS